MGIPNHLYCMSSMFQPSGQLLRYSVYDARKTKYSLQKEDNLINIYEETGAQNIKNKLQSSTENEKIEELKRKPRHRKFYRHLERPSVAKEKSTAWLCAQA